MKLSFCTRDFTQSPIPAPTVKFFRLRVLDRYQRSVKSAQQPGKNEAYCSIMRPLLLETRRSSTLNARQPSAATGEVTLQTSSGNSTSVPPQSRYRIPSPSGLVLFQIRHNSSAWAY